MAVKTASDSAEVVRATADQLLPHLMTQKEAHEQELARLKARHIAKEDGHLSVLGAGEDRLRDQHELLS
jgi:hypothetical protein